MEPNIWRISRGKKSLGGGGIVESEDQDRDGEVLMTVSLAHSN